MAQLRRRSRPPSRSSTKAARAARNQLERPSWRITEQPTYSSLSALGQVPALWKPYSLVRPMKMQLYVLSFAVTSDLYWSLNRIMARECRQNRGKSNSDFELST